MKLKKLSVLLLSATLLAGCTGNGAGQSTTAAETTTETTAETTPAAETATEAETTTETTDSGNAAEGTENGGFDLLAGLTENEYDGLEMTAVILPRNAILPGSTIPVTVTVTNNGDKSVSYVQGSGSFSTPQALYMEVDGLQPVLPEDHLGIATMDYRVNELKPGENIQFVLYVKAIEPSDEFNNYTYELYNAEQSYIGDMDMDELFENYSDLVPAAAGSYEGNAVFIYHTIENAEDANPFGEATGYIKAAITIGVS